MSSDRDDTLSRERTAQLLKRLRSLARQSKMLKADIDEAEREVLTRHARTVNPRRARFRK